MGPRAGLDRCGKSRPHRDSIPGTVQPVVSNTRYEFKKIQIVVTPHFPKYYTVNTCHDFPSFPPQCLLWAEKFTK